MALVSCRKLKADSENRSRTVARRRKKTFVPLTNLALNRALRTHWSCLYCAREMT